MLTLLLRDEGRAGSVWRVWPDPEPVEPGRVHETGSYLFELTGDEAAEDATLLIDDRELEGLRRSSSATARWRWTPGFHAGMVEAELRGPGLATQRFEVITDPDLRKLTRDDFDTMVREILEDTFALFALTSFRKGIARGTGNRPPPIARLEFLRSRISQLEEVAGAIARRPRRMLAAEVQARPYHRAMRATGPEIIRSLRSGRLLRETHDEPSRLPPVLKGYLPEHIRMRERRSSLDLPEHRQMAACLRTWAAWLGEVAVLLGGAEADDAELHRDQTAWAARCRRLARRISRLSALAPFADAADAAPHLALSQLFRHDPNYRQFFRLWHDMNLGIAAVFGDFLQMPIARTFDLYELWCFLRLVRAATDLWGPGNVDNGDLFVVDGAGGVTIMTGAVTMPLGSGWKLCFQREYQEFWKEPDGRGSFSRPMMPDIVAAREAAEAEPPRLIVLDAKYRIETGLGAALSSIHTYRDALVREVASGEIAGVVTAAYLLAPHIAEPVAPYRDTNLPGRLFHPDYRRSFRFGAVTMRPGMSAEVISNALRSIVADAVAV